MTGTLPLKRILFTLLLLAGSSWAQNTVVSWWPKGWDAAFEMAEKRNVPVLIGFIQDVEEANERIVAGLYKDPGFGKLTEKVVPIIASMEIHKPAVQEIRGSKESVCSKFGWVKCSRHKEHEMMARAVCWPSGAVSTPAHILLLPDGTEVGRLIDVHPTSSYEDLVGQGIKKLGRGLTQKAWADGNERLKQVKTALDEARLKDAVTGLQELTRTVRGTPLGRAADELRQRLDERGRNLETEATRLVSASDHVGALRILREGVQTFRGTPLERDLKSAASKLVRTKEGRAAARILDKERKARPSWDKARQYETKRDYARAVRAYFKVLSAAPGSPLAGRARKRIDELAADEDIGPLIRKTVGDSEADLLFKQATRLRARDPKQARAMLEKVVADWPASPAAKKAKRLLERQGQEERQFQELRPLLEKRPGRDG